MTKLSKQEKEAIRARDARLADIQVKVSGLDHEHLCKCDLCFLYMLVSAREKVVGEMRGMIERRVGDGCECDTWDESDRPRDPCLAEKLLDRLAALEVKG